MRSPLTMTLIRRMMTRTRKMVMATRRLFRGMTPKPWTLMTIASLAGLARTQRRQKLNPNGDCWYTRCRLLSTHLVPLSIALHPPFLLLSLHVDCVSSHCGLCLVSAAGFLFRFMRWDIFALFTWTNCCSLYRSYPGSSLDHSSCIHIAAPIFVFQGTSPVETVEFRKLCRVLRNR